MKSDIRQGECTQILSEITDETFDICVTSPPYDDLREYGKHSWNFQETAQQIYRTLKPGGVLCWNVNDSMVGGSETLTSAKQKIFFREECGFLIHDTMIYERLNFSFPSKNRYHQMFEYVFVLSKGKPKTFNPICDKKNVSAGKSVLGRNTQRQRNGDKLYGAKNICAEFGMRGNVWRGKTRGQEDVCRYKGEHPAAMPKWLASDLIVSFSDPGDLVLDPFAGSGTTGEQALRLGREAFLIEIEPDYIAIIKNNIENTVPGFVFAK